MRWIAVAGDDAGQQSMMMSPGVWRDTIKPHLERVADVGRAKCRRWPIIVAAPWRLSFRSHRYGHDA